MFGLLTLLIALPVLADLSESDREFLPPPTMRPLFLVAHVGPDGTLVRLDEQALDRLLHRSKQGDPFTIPLPGSDATLNLDHSSLDPSKDLDCCSVTLVGGGGAEARIMLTRSFSVRDFDVVYEGRTYHYRATGNGNFLVK